MNYYEHTLIAKQDLTEKENKALIDKYKSLINKNSGEVLRTEEWGLKNFTHKVKKKRKGFYFHMKFTGDGKTIEELEKAENIDVNLLRFLTVKIKKDALDINFFEKKSPRDIERPKDIEKNEKKQKT